MGSWSKDDENGNANGKKAIGFDKQNKNYAPVSLLLYISLPSLHDVPQRQTSYLILRLKEEANTRRGLYFFHSFFPSFSLSLSLFSSLTQTQSLRILRQKIHQHLTNWTTWMMSCNERLRPELPRFFYGSVALRRGTSNQYIIDSICLLENSDLSESPVSLTEKKIPFLQVFTKPNKLIIFGCLRQFSSLLLLFLFLLLSFHQRVERHRHPLSPAKFSSEELNQSDQQVLLQGGCKETQTLDFLYLGRAATRIPKVFEAVSKTTVHVRTKHLVIYWRYDVVELYTNFLGNTHVPE